MTRVERPPRVAVTSVWQRRHCGPPARVEDARHLRASRIVGGSVRNCLDPGRLQCVNVDLHLNKPTIFIILLGIAGLRHGDTMY